MGYENHTVFDQYLQYTISQFREIREFREFGPQFPDFYGLFQERWQNSPNLGQASCPIDLLDRHAGRSKPRIDTGPHPRTYVHNTPLRPLSLK